MLPDTREDMGRYTIAHNGHIQKATVGHSVTGHLPESQQQMMCSGPVIRHPSPLCMAHVLEVSCTHIVLSEHTEYVSVHFFYILRLLLTCSTITTADTLSGMPVSHAAGHHHSDIRLVNGGGRPLSHHVCAGTQESE